MPALLMCFDAPMQSWGTTSRFTHRDTALEPTKSGVIGLLAAALGLPRDHGDIERLGRELKLSVRVDREGLLERDYHTVQNVPNTDASNTQTVVTNRYYLADALFLVGVEGSRSDIDAIHAAVQHPNWPIHFGRKAFVPARPLVHPTGATGLLTGGGITEEPLTDAMRGHPWLEDRLRERRRELKKIDDGQSVPLRLVTDCPPGHPEAELRHDRPISFERGNRRYGNRTIHIDYVPLTPEMLEAGDPACT